MPDTGGFMFGSKHHQDKEKEKPEKGRPEPETEKDKPRTKPPADKPTDKPTDKPKTDDPASAKPKGAADTDAYHPKSEAGGGEAADQPDVEAELAEFQRQHPEEAGKQVRTVNSPVGGLEYPAQPEPADTQSIQPDSAVESQTTGGQPPPYGSPPPLPNTQASAGAINQPGAPTPQTQPGGGQVKNNQQQGPQGQQQGPGQTQPKTQQAQSGFSPTQASPASQKPQPGKTGKAQDNVIMVEVELPVNGMNFRGVCERCGWQTYQPEEQLAQDGVLQHLRGTHNIK